MATRSGGCPMRAGHLWMARTQYTHASMVRQSPAPPAAAPCSGASSSSSVRSAPRMPANRVRAVRANPRALSGCRGSAVQVRQAAGRAELCWGGCCVQCGRAACCASSAGTALQTGWRHPQKYVYDHNSRLELGEQCARARVQHCMQHAGNPLARAASALPRRAAAGCAAAGRALAASSSVSPTAKRPRLKSFCSSLCSRSQSSGSRTRPRTSVTRRSNAGTNTASRRRPSSAPVACAAPRRAHVRRRGDRAAAGVEHGPAGGAPTAPELARPIAAGPADADQPGAERGL